MLFKAISASLLMNKAIRINAKKNGYKLTILGVQVLYAALLIKDKDKKPVHATAILKKLEYQCIYSTYDSIKDHINIFTLDGILEPYQIPGKLKTTFYIVTPLGYSVLQGFELCLRRCRHDR